MKKKTRLNGYVYDFFVDLFIDANNIINIIDASIIINISI